jgi:hypothetical protein
LHGWRAKTKASGSTVEVHLVTHPVGRSLRYAPMIRRQDHIIVMRSRRMRWTVEDQTLEAEAGDVIVTPTGRRGVCIYSPALPKPES